MKLIVKQGTTSKRLVIFIQDSSKTTGVGLTGLTNASAGLIWYYYREDSGTSTAVTLAAETIGTWTSGGFVEIDSTHLAGFYEIGVPNAALTGTGSPTWVVMQLSGATNMVPVNIELELSIADLIGAIPTVNVTQWLGTAVTAATAGVPDVNVKNYNNQLAATDGNNLPKVDVEDWRGTAARFTVGGFPDVNVQYWLGTAVTAASPGIPDVNVKNYNNVAAVTDINSLPKVDVEDWKGAAVLVPATAGQPKVEVAVNDDKTGYALTQAFPANFSVLAINTSGQVTIGTNADKTGYSLAQAFPTNFSSLAIDASGRVTLVPSQITVKKNVALAGFTFPMFSSTAPNSLVTGRTVAAQRSIDGGAVAACTNAVSEIGSGIYKLDLAAADVNGNSITFIFTAAGALDASVTVVTQP